MRYVGLLDTSGIQNFVYRSNRLADIATASAQIEALSDADSGLFAQECHTAGADLIFVAAGNAMFSATDCHILQNAFQTISRALLERGEGLEIMCSIQPYEAGGLARACAAAQRDLDRRKLTQPRNTGFQFPGLDAAHPAMPAAPLRTLPPALPAGWTEPRELDTMICQVRGEESGLMAIVSIDGIGMGKRLFGWADEFCQLSICEQDDEAFIEEYRAWSESLKIRWRSAWEQTLGKLTTQFVPAASPPGGRVWQQGDRILEAPALANGGYLLPCRRIYQGGDDLCFVADAHVALSMAAFLVSTLEGLVASDVPEAFRTITASIGVVFVDSHFPFFRAVELAGALQKKAKRKAAESNENAPPSVLGWWVNREGSLEQEPPAFAGASLKPYLLKSSQPRDPLQPWASLDWPTIEKEVLAGLQVTYVQSRGKFKDLMEAVFDGPTAVRRLLLLRPVETLSGEQNTLDFVQRPYQQENGFLAGGTENTPLLDAGELFDLHFSFR